MYNTTSNMYTISLDFKQKVIFPLRIKWMELLQLNDDRWINCTNNNNERITFHETLQYPYHRTCHTHSIVTLRNIK